MSILLRKSFSIQIATVKSTAQHHLAPFCCLSCKAIEVVTDFEQALCVFTWNFDKKLYYMIDVAKTIIF